MPMGRVDYCYVRPMDFGEFLFATGRSILHERRPDLRDSIAPISLLGTIAEALDKALLEYTIVGGMPEVVTIFIESKSFIETTHVHHRLLTSFCGDIPKCAKGDLQRKNLAQA